MFHDAGVCRAECRDTRRQRAVIRSQSRGIAALFILSACAHLPSQPRGRPAYWGFTGPWDERSTATIEAHGGSLDRIITGWIALDSTRSMLGVPHGVVLELKCLSAVPLWLSHVVGITGLRKIRYSKYCRGIERWFARDTLLGVLNQT